MSLQGENKEMNKEPMVPLSQLEKILDDARYSEDIEADLYELVNKLKKERKTD